MKLLDAFAEIVLKSSGIRDVQAKIDSIPLLYRVRGVMICDTVFDEAFDCSITFQVGRATRETLDAFLKELNAFPAHWQVELH